MNYMLFPELILLMNNGTAPRNDADRIEDNGSILSSRLMNFSISFPFLSEIETDAGNPEKRAVIQADG